MKKPERYSLIFKPLGKAALIVEWPAEISENILTDILDLQSLIQTKKIIGIQETVNGYNSLTLFFDDNVFTFDSLTEKIRSLYQERVKTNPATKRIWQIPVCYDQVFGIDLQELAKAKQLSIEEVISLHHSQTYTVYFIGFLPGFLYLGGLPDEIHMPRRATPRLKISKGAVAIGGAQTGIYPIESPGGWNIIGNCPLRLFDPLKNPPCFVQAGDQLKFYMISKSEHESIKSMVENDSFRVKFEES